MSLPEQDSTPPNGLPPLHAAVSWTYMEADRHEEALLRIRRLLKEHAGWWTALDDKLEREAFERLGIPSDAARTLSKTEAK